MKIPKLELGQAVLVTWVDAGGSAGWSHIEATPDKPITVPQIGFWLHANEHAVYIAQAIPPDGDGMILGPSCVPIGCVKSIRKVKV